MTVPRSVNRFDPTVSDHQPPAPTLSSILRRAIREGHRSLRVALPGKIVGISGPLRVDIQPTLQAQFNSAPEPVTLPVLPDVPVLMPAGAKYSVQYPLALGDTGLLVFADRSLDNWLAGDGGVTDPKDARLHDLTDAVFLPGLAPNAAAAAADSSGDVVVRNGASQLRLQPSGKVVLGSAQVNLVAQVKALTDAVEALLLSLSTTNAIPGSPILPNIVAPQAKLDKIAQALESIQGA